MISATTNHRHQRSSSPVNCNKSLPDASLNRSLGPLLGRLGTLEVRLVADSEELKTAQRLRYKVFYEEMSASDNQDALVDFDVDPFDYICDHLIVVDTATQKTGKIVGTYRLLRQDIAAKHHGFYSQNEYDMAPLLARHPHRKFLELGRSCVLKEYRVKRTVELLWHGIWAYVLHHKMDVMFGCASLEGTEIELLKDQLGFLSSFSPAPQDWQVKAHSEHYVAMKPEAGINQRQALTALPPLVKGYLRLGAYIGDGAVIDHAFGTTDVLIILPVENINPRYVSHYGKDAGRYSA